jgi:hypothetical protein
MHFILYELLSLRQVPNKKSHGCVVPSGHITFVAGILGLSFCDFLIRRPGFSPTLIE